MIWLRPLKKSLWPWVKNRPQDNGEEENGRPWCGPVAVKVMSYDKILDLEGRASSVWHG